MSTSFTIQTMNTIGDRIKKLRSDLSINQRQLAEKLGIEPPSVNQWESDKTKPSAKSLTSLCQILNTTPEYILYGVHPEEAGASYAVNEPSLHYNPNTEPASVPKTKQVPVISWIQAGSTHVAYIDESEEYEKVTCYKKHSNMTYALRVMGDSMTTDSGPYSFPEGTIIIVDPEQKGDTTNGIFVVAKENGNDAVTFKQLKYDGATPYLNPLNKDPVYKKIFENFRVLGKVIDVKIELP
jgi:SOS-response transcriptional repressor LexA